ncbi:MAG TPA: pyridoxamine 5'-phosphate oxidase [Longimicrobiales bacterium]|nr:pyridoxamine 5'-phosphate oxidase [Longimicrobiales bacterium]
MSLKSSLRTLVTLGQGVVQGIPEAAADRDPVELFGEWFKAAEESGIFLPEAVALATATVSGAPSVRMVLLKGADTRGFVFYTNYGSRKASDLEANPQAALCFHWAVLERQVRVEGVVERVSRDESEAYFSSRPRGSRIGAWASNQSEHLPSREVLEERVRHFEKEYPGEEVPLPPFWGGYVLRPSRIEFWQGKADRLHERLVFSRAGDAWTTGRLYP